MIRMMLILYSRPYLINNSIILFQGILESELPIDVPVVILGNKTDKPGCHGRVELLENLEIQEDVQKVRTFNYMSMRQFLFLWYQPLLINKFFFYLEACFFP